MCVCVLSSSTKDSSNSVWIVPVACAWELCTRCVCMCVCSLMCVYVCFECVFSMCVCILYVSAGVCVAC